MLALVGALFISCFAGFADILNKVVDVHSNLFFIFSQVTEETFMYDI